MSCVGEIRKWSRSGSFQRESEDGVWLGASRKMFGLEGEGKGSGGGREGERGTHLFDCETTFVAHHVGVNRLRFGRTDVLGERAHDSLRLYGWYEQK